MGEFVEWARHDLFDVGGDIEEHKIGDGEGFGFDESRSAVLQYVLDPLESGVHHTSDHSLHVLSGDWGEGGLRKREPDVFHDCPQFQNLHSFYKATA